jgi:methanogenic corrinoid protein MtbC1
MNPLNSINKGFVVGMNYIGERFDCNAMFLPDLVLTGEAMKSSIKEI